MTAPATASSTSRPCSATARSPSGTTSTSARSRPTATATNSGAASEYLLSRGSVSFPGFKLFPGRLGPEAQAAIVAEVLALAEAAPFFRPVTPGGQAMSVTITNFGPLGWVTDAGGYRYSPT